MLCQQHMRGLKESIMIRKSNALFLLPMSALALCLLPPAFAAGGGGGGGGGSPSASTPSYDPAVEYQKGTTAFRANDFVTAAKHFKKVVSAVPKDPTAQYLLGASYMGMGNFKKAAKPLELAVKYDAKMIDAQRDLGVTQAKLGKADKAGAQLAALKSMQTTCGDTCADKAKLVDAIAKVEAAMGGKQAAGPIAPDIKLSAAKAADETYVTAVSLINEKRYEEAIAFLQDARWAAGPHPDILTYLGFANRKLGRYDLAEGYYQAALGIFPEHRGALEYYGELKLERGNVAGAKAHLAKLEEICGFGCNEADELRRWILEKAPSAS
jgi:tetratricopeptide (TPR) repeat protein